MGKPIVRWTFHPGVSHAGFECLINSIRSWQSIYGSAWRYFLCCNKPCERAREACRLGLELVDQSQFISSLPVPPYDTAWKFYPPRLDTTVHEIILDNDVWIFDRSPSIDAFLKSNSLVTQAAHRRYFGQFDSLIPPDAANINTGIMGWPPGYDTAARISEFLGLYCNSQGWSSRVDDQGCFAYLMMRHPAFLIPLEEISVVNPSVDFAPYKIGSCGTHFVSLNSGHSQYYRSFVTGYK